MSTSEISESNLASQIVNTYNRGRSLRNPDEKKTVFERLSRLIFPGWTRRAQSLDGDENVARQKTFEQMRGVFRNRAEQIGKETLDGYRKSAKRVEEETLDKLCAALEKSLQLTEDEALVLKDDSRAETYAVAWIVKWARAELEIQKEEGRELSPDEIDALAKEIRDNPQKWTGRNPNEYKYDLFTELSLVDLILSARKNSSDAYNELFRLVYNEIAPLLLSAIRVYDGRSDDASLKEEILARAGLKFAELFNPDAPKILGYRGDCPFKYYLKQAIIRVWINDCTKKGAKLVTNVDDDAIALKDREGSAQPSEVKINKAFGRFKELFDANFKALDPALQKMMILALVEGYGDKAVLSALKFDVFELSQEIKVRFRNTTEISIETNTGRRLVSPANFIRTCCELADFSELSREEAVACIKRVYDYAVEQGIRVFEKKSSTKRTI